MNKDIGKPPELAWLPIGKLSVDAKYQRDTGSRRSRNLIEKITADFRWSRFGVVLVVKHNGGWFVIDGQHRVEAARARGDIRKIPAVVLPHATVQAAAADFVAINRDRVAVTPLHIHHAQLAAGDPEAKAIDSACRKAGAEICRYPVPSDKMKPGQTLAVASIGRLVKFKGEVFTVAVLQSCVTAGSVNAVAIRQAAEAMGFSRGTTQKPGQLTQARKRACLRCQKPFRSAGPHQRMCDACRVAT